MTALNLHKEMKEILSNEDLEKRDINERSKMVRHLTTSCHIDFFEIIPFRNVFDFFLKSCFTGWGHSIAHCCTE